MCYSRQSSNMMEIVDVCRHNNRQDFFWNRFPWGSQRRGGTSRLLKDADMLILTLISLHPVLVNKSCLFSRLVVETKGTWKWKIEMRTWYHRSPYCRYDDNNNNNRLESRSVCCCGCKWIRRLSSPVTLNNVSSCPLRQIVTRVKIPPPPPPFSYTLHMQPTTHTHTQYLCQPDILLLNGVLQTVA